MNTASSNIVSIKAVLNCDMFEVVNRSLFICDPEITKPRTFVNMKVFLMAIAWAS